MNNVSKPLLISSIIILSLGVAFLCIRLGKVSNDLDACIAQLAMSQDNNLKLQVKCDSLRSQNDSLARILIDKDKAFEDFNGSGPEVQYGHDFMDVSDFLDGVLSGVLRERGWSQSEIDNWVSDAFSDYMETGRVSIPNDKQ